MVRHIEGLALLVVAPRDAGSHLRRRRRRGSPACGGKTQKNSCCGRAGTRCARAGAEGGVRALCQSSVPSSCSASKSASSVWSSQIRAGASVRGRCRRARRAGVSDAARREQGQAKGFVFPLCLSGEGATVWILPCSAAAARSSRTRHPRIDAGALVPAFSFSSSSRPASDRPLDAPKKWVGARAADADLLLRLRDEGWLPSSPSRDRQPAPAPLEPPTLHRQGVSLPAKIHSVKATICVISLTPAFSQWRGEMARQENGSVNREGPQIERLQTTVQDTENTQRARGGGLSGWPIYLGAEPARGAAGIGA